MQVRPSNWIVSHRINPGSIAGRIRLGKWKRNHVCAAAPYPPKNVTSSRNRIKKKLNNQETWIRKQISPFARGFPMECAALIWSHVSHSKMESASGLKGSPPPWTTRCLDSPYLNPPPIVSYPAEAVFYTKCCYNSYEIWRWGHPLTQVLLFTFGNIFMVSRPWDVLSFIVLAHMC